MWHREQGQGKITLTFGIDEWLSFFCFIKIKIMVPVLVHLKFSKLFSYYFCLMMKLYNSEELEIEITALENSLSFLSKIRWHIVCFSDACPNLDVSQK